MEFRRVLFRSTSINRRRKSPPKLRYCRRSYPSLPLDRPRRLAGDVVGHPVDAAHSVGDAHRHSAQEVIRAHGGRADKTILAERRSEEHTSELQSLMRISYAVFCLKTNKNTNNKPETTVNVTTPTN